MNRLFRRLITHEAPATVAAVGPRPRIGGVAVVALVALLLVPVGGPAAAAPTPSRVHPDVLTATASAQLTGLATQIAKRTATFHQNGTGIYAGSSTISTWPTNFTTTGNYSSVGSFTETFSATATGGFYPQVNITQGSVLVANTTDTIPFTVAPIFSSTVLTQRTVELFTAAAALPAVAAYTVTTVATQAISYTYSTTLNWSANQSSYYQATFPLAAARGYWLNQSQTFLPFPSVPTGVNYSTVSVLLNGSAYANFQVVQGGVYVNVASVGRGYTATLTARFTVLPAISGAAPILVATQYNVLNATTNQINLTWTNQMNVAYAGTFIIQTHFNYTVDPASITIQAGLRNLPSGSFVVAGNTISILPLVLIVNSGSAVALFIDFRFANAPPTSILNANTIAFGSVTWGEILGGLTVVFAVGAVGVFLLVPRYRRLRGTDLEASQRPAFTMAVFAVVFGAIWLLLEIEAGVQLL